MWWLASPHTIFVAWIYHNLDSQVKIPVWLAGWKLLFCDADYFWLVRELFRRAGKSFQHIYFKQAVHIVRCLVLLLKQRDWMTIELVSFCKGQDQGGGDVGKVIWPQLINSWILPWSRWTVLAANSKYHLWPQLSSTMVLSAPILFNFLGTNFCLSLEKRISQIKCRYVCVLIQGGFDGTVMVKK